MRGLDQERAGGSLSPQGSSAGGGQRGKRKRQTGTGCENHSLQGRSAHPVLGAGGLCVFTLHPRAGTRGEGSESLGHSQPCLWPRIASGTWPDIWARGTAD